MRLALLAASATLTGLSCGTSPPPGPAGVVGAPIRPPRSLAPRISSCELEWPAARKYPWTAPQVRLLTDGRAFVLDTYSRRIILLDRDCRTTTVVDSASRPSFPPGAKLLAAPGDSTWVLDQPSRGFRVLDSRGRLIRRAGFEAPLLPSQVGAPWANAQVDSRGRLVFAVIRSTSREPDVPHDDSLELRRVTFPGRDSELLAVVRRPGGHWERDSMRLRLTLPVVDEADAWTVASNGSLVVVRADGTVEWHDSTRIRTTALGWQGRRLSASDQRSLRRAADSLFLDHLGANTNGDHPAIVVGGLTVLSPLDPTATPLFVPDSPLADMRGRVWLRVGVRQLFRNPQPPDYVIIDSTGRVVDRVSFPTGEVPVAFTRREIFTVRLEDGRCAFGVYRY